MIRGPVPGPPPGSIDSRLPHTTRLFDDAFLPCLRGSTVAYGMSSLSWENKVSFPLLLGRGTPIPLHACSPFFSWPNQKPQRWFHELTHGTGRQRDGRPAICREPAALPTVGPAARPATLRRMPTQLVNPDHFRPSMFPLCGAAFPWTERSFLKPTEDVGVQQLVEILLLVSPPLKIRS